MAVVGGLSHSSISRLKETHSYLTPEVVKVQQINLNLKNKCINRFSSGVFIWPNTHLTQILHSLFQIWREMTELVSSSNNYSCYRKAFSECQGFKIPILGVHLKDLIAVHVVFSDWVDGSNKVNLVKMHQLYVTFNELVSLQSAVAHVEPNMDLIYLLTVRHCHSTGETGLTAIVFLADSFVLLLLSTSKYFIKTWSAGVTVDP